MILFLKNLLFTLIAPGTVSIIFPYLITQNHHPASHITVICAVILFIIGGAIYTWCVWDFASYGRGTPAPIDAPKRLVVRGLYRYVRNPMYLGVLTILLAWIILYQTLGLLIYTVIVFTCFNAFVIFYEEPHLENIFGDDYLAYKLKVGRWLPRFRHEPHP